MNSTRLNLYATLVLACALGLTSFEGRAQSASSLYTWGSTGDIQAWIRSFGAANTTATLANTTAGELTVIETSAAAGGSQAFSDGFNRVRGLPTGPSGGLDLTGLSYLQFDLGHNGAGNINVQFYVQASTSSSFVALGPDLVVTPGINTYQVPLAGLTPAQQVYIRTMGLNIRDHAGLGNVTWTIQELRSGGAGLSSRTLASFDIGTAEGGLQGAIANFDLASIAGNNGGQNQTGLSQNPGGSGSLQWIDVAGGAGGAISLGNGTAWGGNTFNNRTTDLSNYGKMIVRMSATETSTSNGGAINVQSFFQNNNFSSFQSPGTDSLPIDGLFHDLEFDLSGLTDMNVVDQTGLNLGSHTDELRINVDNVFFVVPEPNAGILLLSGIFGLGLAARCKKSVLKG
jgi:hypothetical protein